MTIAKNVFHQIWERPPVTLTMRGLHRQVAINYCTALHSCLEHRCPGGSAFVQRCLTPGYIHWEWARSHWSEGHHDLYFRVQWLCFTHLEDNLTYNVILWDNESMWHDLWPQNKCGSQWPQLLFIDAWPQGPFIGNGLEVKL